MKKRLRDIRMQKEGSWNDRLNVDKTKMSSKPTNLLKKKSHKRRASHNANQSFIQLYSKTAKVDTYSTNTRVGRTV